MTFIINVITLKKLKARAKCIFRYKLPLNQWKKKIWEATFYSQGTLLEMGSFELQVVIWKSSCFVKVIFRIQIPD